MKCICCGCEIECGELCEHCRDFKPTIVKDIFDSFKDISIEGESINDNK